MRWERIGLLLSLAALPLVVFVGCRTQSGGVTTARVSAPALAETPYVELTYPQSDDQGRFVSLPQQEGDVTVCGIVAARNAPTAVVVNGATVEPYPVQDIAPFGTPAGYQTYGFRAPMEVTPDTQFTIGVQEPGVTYQDAVFMPNAPLASERLRILAEESPQMPVAQYRLGNAYLAQQRYDDAIVVYRRSVTLQPRFGWGYYGLGRSYYATRRPTEAVVVYRRAANYYPWWAEPRFELGITFGSLGRGPEAVLQFRDAIRLRPRWAEPHYRLGLVYYDRGWLGGAATEYRQAATLYPVWAEPHYRLALVLTRQQRYDDAILSYREALRFAPARRAVHRDYAVALYHRGYYRNAWNEVHVAQRGGVRLNVDFVRVLRQRMPEPAHEKVARVGGTLLAQAPGRGQGQTNSDPKRQDGVRKPGPHAEGQTSGPQHQTGRSHGAPPGQKKNGR